MRGRADARHRAPSSVFAMGQAAKPKRARPIVAADVRIVSNVSVPPPSVGRGSASPYAALLARMRPGDMVELSVRQSFGLISMAKKLQIEVTRRAHGDGMRIWRK